MKTPNAWKPFGNGQRSWIGRGLALQEAVLFLAMLLQRFDLSPVDPDYQLKIKQTLTIKPDERYRRARRRDTTIVSAPKEGTQAGGRPVPAAAAIGIPLRVLFGSDAGTSQAFAERIGHDAKQRGYTPSVDTLDSTAGHLPTRGAVIVASYEGKPPDNARQLLAWVSELPAGALDGVRYSTTGMPGSGGRSPRRSARTTRPLRRRP